MTKAHAKKAQALAPEGAPEWIAHWLVHLAYANDRATDRYIVDKLSEESWWRITCLTQLAMDELTRLGSAIA